MRLLAVFFSIVAVVILFITAHAFCEGVWVKGFQLKKEIDLIDFSILIFSSFVTIGTGWYIGKKVTEKRYEKDYFIQDLKNIERDINLILQKTYLQRVEVEIMVGAMNQLKGNIELFSSTVNIFDKNIEVQNLEAQFIVLYSKATNSDSSYLEMNATNRNEIKYVCSSFIKEIRLLICLINKR